MEKQLIQQMAPNSCELSTNAKGKVQATVKVYHDDPATAAEIALKVLKSVTEQLGDKAASG
jgi:hypothetical protein